MHEFALADAVIRSALEFAEQGGIARITKLVVRIGELQTIAREVFDYALKEIMPAAEPRLAEAVIVLETEPARFRCRPCAHEFTLAESGGPKEAEDAEAMHFIPELAHACLRCPRCQSPDFELLEGRGVSIASIEGE